MRLWDVKTGKNLKTWEFPTAVKRVEFNEDGTKLLGVTEKRMGYLGNIVVININPDVDAEQTDERALTIVCDESKATVAGWSYLSKYIIAGHEDGSVSQYDAKVRSRRNPPLFFPYSSEGKENDADPSFLSLHRTAIFSTMSRCMSLIPPLPTFSGLATAHTSSRPARIRLPRCVRFEIHLL